MDQNVLTARLQAFFYIVRRGQWEQALAILTLVLFGAAAYLRQEFKEVLPWAGYAVYVLCIVTFLWLVFSVWKKAAPPPTPPDKTLPNAIKGLLPFTAKDGALFTQLGRRMELQSLLSFAQNDQIGMTVVRGESGAGKTSLLQAGLAYNLGDENYIYWEAVPAKASDALLHAIRNQVTGLVTMNALESLPDACPKRCVLILDQFEQLRMSEPEHSPVFSLLERICKAPPPHKLSAIVAFRREYTPDWLDFEQARGLRAEQMSVNLLAQRAAEDVLVILSGEAGFTLDQALVTNFISSVARTKGISPADVAIGVLSLANLIQQRGTSHVGMTDYELAGGAEGLLLSFVQQKLEEIPEQMRAPLLKGMVLTLVDLSNNQRITAGELAAVIAAQAEVPESALAPWLSRLSHPRIRLLEVVGPNRYRLPHDRLVPVLRRLTGRALASVDQLRLIFETEYARWRETRDQRYLLGGKELHGILRQHDQFILDETATARTEYLTACLRRRSVLRLVTGGAVFAALATVYGAIRGLDDMQQKQALKSWGLPPELFSVQHEKLPGSSLKVSDSRPS